jgi:hypothetical protein
LKPDLKTPLPRKLTVTDGRKLLEMAERGGVKMHSPAGRAMKSELEKGVGGIWLDLTDEQYAKLRKPH